MAQQLIEDLEAMKGFFTDPIFLVETSPIVAPKTDNKPNIDPAHASPAQTIQLIGSYKKNILVMVNDVNHAVSSEEGNLLLKNILKYLQINAEDFGIINLSKYPNLHFDELQDQYKPEKIFAFGLPADKLLLESLPAENYIRKAEVDYFLGAALAEMAKNTALKKAFNQSLKHYNA